MLTSRHNRQTDNVRQAGRQAAKQAGGGRHQAYRQADKQAGYRQAGNQTDGVRQAGRQISK